MIYASLVIQGDQICAIIRKHQTDSLLNFIRYVHEQGGVFLSADEYATSSRAPVAKRLGMWVDYSLGPHSPEQIVEDVTSHGIGDVFLMAKDPEGHLYFRLSGTQPHEKSHLFDETFRLLKKAQFPNQ